MFKNRAECINGTLSFQDIAKGPERQQEKKYFGDPSVLGSNITRPFNTSAVLHQVEGSNIPASGWLG
eukprot:10308685-Ditylum_brightwellii.AAC.1